MLFNSPQFIGIFFPVALVGFYLLARTRTARSAWLLLASLAFYAYWDYRFLPVLLLSIGFNWSICNWFEPKRLKAVVVLGLVFNLALIGVFKYLDFFGLNLAELFGLGYERFDLILPLGISFFTFQQISYLLDRYRGQASGYSLLDYSVYVAFFPQLIAGPIVRHSEIIPQYQKSPLRPDIYRHLATGLVFFTLGLAKKVLVADRLAETATPLFSLASSGEVLSQGEAWVASLSYSLQLYFDFSGYSDMAIGLALMFGLQLPYNFNAPYKAANLQDFWRRWHITLSRFLRDYLYIPLGGSQNGKLRLYAALMLTMLLGGLWHGAGWTFVIWGGLHGLALCCHRVWISKNLRMPGYLGWPTLMLFLCFSWVVFRADSMSTAIQIWSSMVGAQGFDFRVSDSPNRWFTLLAAVLAIIGPTTQELAQYTLTPKKWLAVLTAFLIFYLFLKVANDGYSEFLYFQF